MSTQTDKIREALEKRKSSLDAALKYVTPFNIHKANEDDYLLVCEALAALSEIEAQPSEPRLTVDQAVEFVKKWIAEMQPDSPIDPDEWNQPEWIKQESILRDRLTKVTQP